MEWDQNWYWKQDWYNRKQWVLVPVPVLNQYEPFCMILYFSFSSCTSTSLNPIPVRCEDTIKQTNLPRVIQTENGTGLE